MTAADKTGEERFLDRIHLEKDLELGDSVAKKLKVSGNIPDIGLVIKAMRHRVYPWDMVLVQVFFEGDNRGGTLMARFTMTVTNVDFDFEGYLPGDGQQFCSATVHTNDNSFAFAVSALVFSESLQGAHKGLFRDFFETGAGSDVTLSACGRDFRAHRLVLSARSAVFRAMFAAGMQEQQTCHVEITDVRPEVLREVLRYVYLGRVLDVDLLAPELVYAADKYDLQGLKDLCEDVLCTTVSPDNVLELLATTHLLGCDRLRKVAARFLVGRAEEVCATEKWADFRTSYPALTSDLCCLTADDLKAEVPEWRQVRNK